MKNQTLKTLILAAALALSGPVTAWAAGEQGKHGQDGAASADMTAAEVRKVDAASGKVTLKHGPIKHLDMPGMTMVFGVKDKAMLSQVKAGDKVLIKVVSEAGKFTVTELKPAP